MTVIILRNQRIAGTDYAESQSVTKDAATETAWVNAGFAKWAPGSGPGTKGFVEYLSNGDGRIRFSVNGSQEFPAVGEIGSITYDSAGRVSTYIDQGATW
ncbi:MAG: hypothetical protein JSS57_04355, partial [Proteobacteria bacterium]|nr:hypothetical protein [Pseudomonadota bacterium]